MASKVPSLEDGAELGLGVTSTTGWPSNSDGKQINSRMSEVVIVATHKWEDSFIFPPKRIDQDCFASGLT